MPRLKLYAHPFSSFSQKALVALYENATPFEYRVLGDAEAMGELAALWPMKRFPVLVDAGRTVLEASTIVEHLDLHHRAAVRFLPDDPAAALEVRMLDRFFDNYVSTPQQKIVFDRLRPEASRDPAAWPRRAPCSTHRLRLARTPDGRPRIDLRRALQPGRPRRRTVPVLRRLDAPDRRGACANAQPPIAGACSNAPRSRARSTRPGRTGRCFRSARRTATERTRGESDTHRTPRARRRSALRLAALVDRAHLAPSSHSSPCTCRKRRVHSTASSSEAASSSA